MRGAGHVPPEDPPTFVDLYGVSYGHFAEEIYAEIRREAFGQDIGQNSWVTTDELDRFASHLDLGESSRLLDVACGAGGPTLYLARSRGCEVVGVDLHEDAIANANRVATGTGLAERVTFLQADASKPLPFEDGWFQALLCVDAVNHLPNRAAVFREWARLLRPGGKVIFTDPITVTGLLGSDEITIRASAGYYVFAPLGENQRLLAAAGLRLLTVEDATENMADLAERRGDARARRADILRQIEGEQAFDGQQRFFETAAALARERRLSRLVYLAEKVK